MRYLLLLTMLLATPALGQYGPQLGSGGTSTTSDGDVNNIAEIYTVTSATYSPDADDYVILVETDEDVTVTLPTAITLAGRILHIKDYTGGAFSNTLDIVTEGAALIDGEVSIAITTAYSAVTLICDGTNWYII